jgi:hypothetical protein
MRRPSTIICIAIGLLLGLGLARAEGETVTSISLDRPVHFTASDGSEIHVAATIYRIEQAGESHLRLVKDDATAIEIPATRLPYDEPVSSPSALVIAEEGNEDDLHLVLLLPDKQALDAPGSYSGLTRRGFSSVVVQSLNSVQLAAARSQMKAPQVPTHTLSNPTFS